MIRASLNPAAFNSLIKCLPINYQTVRWVRKPRKPFWLGTAKSKIFRIHNPPVLPPEEQAELRRLNKNYKTAMKSIRAYFVSSKDGDVLAAASHVASEEEILESLKLNQKFNEESARLRADRLAKAASAHENTVIETIGRVEGRRKNVQDRIEELVRIEKERSKEFVTPENLDKKIEECLACEVDHNFAIDLEGNKYTGFQEEMTATPLNITESDSK